MNIIGGLLLAAYAMIGVGAFVAILGKAKPEEVKEWKAEGIVLGLFLCAVFWPALIIAGFIKRWI